jgi:beta-barrel assembly-enhancing protease
VFERIRIACASALLSAGACASATGVIPFSKKDDVKLGRSYAKEIDKAENVEKDPVVNEGIARIGRRVVAGDGTTEGFEFDFKVLHDDAMVNAFALPGGTVYVSTGLIALAEDEAEMAGILAHEIAHVTERHSARRMTDTLGLEAIERAILGDRGVVGGTVARVTQAGFFAYTRRMENEADEVGFELLVKSGYDPYGMPRIFETVARLDRAGRGSIRSFLSDHPDPEDRARAARRRIADLPPWLRTGVANREAWQAYRDSEDLRGGAPAGTSDRHAR